jgi:hypothetical protein
VSEPDAATDDGKVLMGVGVGGAVALHGATGAQRFRLTVAFPYRGAHWHVREVVEVGGGVPALGVIAPVAGGRVYLSILGHWGFSCG